VERRQKLNRPSHYCDYRLRLLPTPSIVPTYLRSGTSTVPVIRTFSYSEVGQSQCRQPSAVRVESRDHMVDNDATVLVLYCTVLYCAVTAVSVTL